MEPRNYSQTLQLLVILWQTSVVLFMNVPRMMTVRVNSIPEIDPFQKGMASNGKTVEIVPVHSCGSTGSKFLGASIEETYLSW